MKAGHFLGLACPTLWPIVDLTFLAGALPHSPTNRPQNIELKCSSFGSSSWTHVSEMGSSEEWLLAFFFYQLWSFASGASILLSSTSPGPWPPGPPYSHSLFPPGTLLRIPCNDCIWQSGQLSLAPQLWASVPASLGLCCPPLLPLALFLNPRLSPALLALLIWMPRSPPIF